MNKPLLNSVEVRIIGCLIEKQITTPEYYPLSLNALVNACNQLQNREPVVSYDEKTVARGIESLREKELIWMVTQAGARVPKYEHRFVEGYSLSPQETAVMCTLMLRGPQTIGEIRGRSSRFLEFSELSKVVSTLESLMTEERGLVTKLPRQPGTKEARYAHLLTGEVNFDPPLSSPKVEPIVKEVREENMQLAQIEEEMTALRLEMAELKQQFDEFRKQFE